MTEGKSIFIDTTKCTACRGCQIACKQWNRLREQRPRSGKPSEPPRSLLFTPGKLVRFSEIEEKERPMVFLPGSMPSLPPTSLQMQMAESMGQAIIKDEKTGAVLYNPKVKVKAADFKEIRESCPYDIPRIDPKTGIMAKCTMCFDRIKEGMLPACVKTCPTGAMNFGDRNEILEKANKRLGRGEGTL